MATTYLERLYKTFGQLFARSVNGVTPDESGNISLSLPNSYDLPKASSTTLGGVTIGSNISVSDGEISISKSNVTNALGYTPPKQDTVYTLPNASENTVGGVKVGQNITVNAGVISLTKANVTTALGYVPSSTDSNYSVFTGATSSSAGVSGLVPAPSAGKQKMYLRADGSWSEPVNTVYDNATQAVAGLMSSSDKTKLDGIAVGANKYVHPSYSAQSNKLYKVTVDSQGHVSATSEVTKSDIVALGIPGEDTKATLSSLGVTAIAKELNVLDGITATTAELNCCDGVTSNIQTQLNNKLSTTGTATKATADASGNNIVSTYATKTALTEGLATKSDTGHSHDEATQSAKGFMSVADKKKLDGIEANANKYVLPPTVPGVLGGVKVGNNITLKEGEISIDFDDVVNALGWIPLKTVNSHEADIHGNVDVSAGFFETDGIKSGVIVDNKSIHAPQGGQWFCFGMATKTYDGNDGDSSSYTYTCAPGLYAGGTKLVDTLDKYGSLDNTIVCFRNADGEWE